MWPGSQPSPRAASWLPLCFPTVSSRRFKKLKVGSQKPNHSSICHCPCHLLAPLGTGKQSRLSGKGTERAGQALEEAGQWREGWHSSYEESNPKDPAAVTESKEGAEASASEGLEKKEK
ncbi:Minor histocompatibility antigen H13 [Myotis brandtii]|uniref:Minor histocompatibility antigen H13 n=1 Tax=Myotis brandtii TaxID=109478 RepID=S7NFX6_MYOBR|nr:Minor histocompatibility antigen H13 [Myotis brandtii]